jgi:hypothetical protein
MLFMLTSRPKAGVKREQLVERLTRPIHKDTWDLLRHGDLFNLLYRDDEQPGFYAVLSAASLEEAKSLVDRGREGFEVFDVEITPVKNFPSFD